MEEKFHREKKTIELIETLLECIEFSSKLCANGKIFYCGISLPYIYFYGMDPLTQIRVTNLTNTKLQTFTKSQEFT
jgi:hypothetical protein